MPTVASSREDGAIDLKSMASKHDLHCKSVAGGQKRITHKRVELIPLNMSRMRRAAYAP